MLGHPCRAVRVAACFEAFAVRTVKMASLPVHLRWELSPVPHEKGRGAYGGSYLETVDWWTKPREKDLVSEVVYMAIGAALYAVFSYLFNGTVFAVPSVSQVALRPAISIPMSVFCWNRNREIRHHSGLTV